MEQAKLTRSEVLKQLDIAEDTLSLYEHELEIETDPKSGGLENFTQGDMESIKLFHRLRESGLTYNEIKLLTSFSEVMKNVDFEGKNEIKNLLSLSPVYRLKQSLNLARQELTTVRAKLQELEEALKKETESRQQAFTGDVSLLQSELEAKQKALNNLDRQLSETLLSKTQLESELVAYREGKPLQIKGKKAKQLYETIVKKDLEIAEIKKKSEDILAELTGSQEERDELKERLELMEDEISEMEAEVEERYQEQIGALREQIEVLVDKKQKEWESYFIQSSESHKTELLTLQRKHEQEILRLKHKIKEQFEEITDLKSRQNPLLGLLRLGAGR